MCENTPWYLFCSLIVYNLTEVIDHARESLMRTILFAVALLIFTASANAAGPASHVVECKPNTGPDQRLPGYHRLRAEQSRAGNRAASDPARRSHGGAAETADTTLDHRAKLCLSKSSRIT